MKNSLILLLIAFGQFAFAQQPVPMFFPADKNSLQVLPQRFEYTVVDERRIQIGDIVIDANRFGFQLSSNPKESAIKFIWPAGLMTSGQLVIKDNAGKAIFSEVISPRNITISPSEDPNETGIRGERAELVVRSVPQPLVMSMRTYPFMQLCIFNEETNTRIYLCSPEVYLNREDDGQYRIRPRSSTKKNSFVQINGKEVGPQGIVFLNAPEETLSFRSLSQNGATLEIETRMKPVDFKDIYRDPESGKLKLTGVGGEPADEKVVIKKNGLEWQVELDPTRPILFLKGESNIPLRQEFFVKGKIPLNEYRPNLLPRTRSMTYRRGLSLRGQAAPQTNLKTNPGSGIIEKKTNNPAFEWNLAKLPAGQTSRHSVQVQTAEGVYLASYDFFKAHPFALGTSVNFMSPANVGMLNLSLQMWLESLFRSTFRWGFEAKYGTLVQKSAEQGDLSELEVKALYRLSEGFNLVDPSASVGASLRQLTLSSTSLSLLGLQYRHENLVKNGKWTDWVNYTGRIYLPSKSGEVEYSYGLHLEAEALKKGFRKDLWYRFAGLLSTDQIKDADSKFNLGAEAGIVWQF